MEKSDVTGIETRGCAKRFFTLIELLVVVAVIAILMALLFPSLSKARELARRSACIGNLKQTALAYASYLDENSCWYPAYYNWRSALISYYGKYVGSNWYLTYDYGNQFSHSHPIFCPEGLSKLDKTTNLWTNGLTRNNITYNQGLKNNGSANWPGQHLRHFGVYAFSKTIVNWCAWRNTYVEAWSGSPEMAPNTHSSGRPVLYADGHVETHPEWSRLIDSTSDHGIPNSSGGPLYDGWNKSALNPQ